MKIIAIKDSWIEGEAVQQLERSSRLPGMQQVVGLPDLHPGKGYPIGAAFACKGMIYPYLLGNDIGCGMGLWQTDLESRKAKLDRLGKRLTGLEEPWPGDKDSFLEEHGLAPSPLTDTALGTIGGGNHFAELQAVVEIVDQAAFNELGLEQDRLTLLVHSGSRGLGEAVLRRHVDRFRDNGLAENSEEAVHYLTEHQRALQWAVVNRELIAHRFLEAIRSDSKKIWDAPHNLVTKESIEGEPLWLHRKGAVPSFGQAVVIPGSRGALTYLVKPAENREHSLFSLAHGAGRKWRRSDSRAKLGKKFSPADLCRTKLGGLVLCEDKDLLYQEAPQAYKDIGVVIEALLAERLISVIATFKPVITYKRRAV